MNKKNFTLKDLGLYCMLSAVTAAVLIAAILLPSTLQIAKANGTVVSEGEYALLDEIQSYVSSYFVGDIEEDTLEDMTAAGYVAGLGDTWSYYLTPEQYAAFQEDEESNYVGIGMTVNANTEGQIEVVQVLENSPAAEAGVLVGDLLIKVDDTEITKENYSGVADLVAGEEGTDVTASFLRGEQVYTFTMTRRAVEKQYVTSAMLSGDVGYVRILRFASGAEEEFTTRVDALLANGATSFIFDVRSNPGGNLNVLISILDRLVDGGDLLIEEYKSGEKYTFKAEAGGLDCPMVVLVNASSYSAAEFFAGVLQEYGLAVVVGEKTTGKGYGQSMFPLSNGGALNLSVIRYYTPKGVSLKEDGVTPDASVELEESLVYKIGNLTPEEDAQLQTAVSYATGEELPADTEEIPETEDTGAIDNAA